jgi:hypothetical protein
VRGVRGAFLGPSRPIETACGEMEHDRCSRRENAIEALAVHALVQAALWSGMAGPAQPGGVPWPRAAGLTAVVLTAVYVITIAPRIHGDGWHGLGLARPHEFAAVWARSGWASRLGATALVVALPLLVVAVGWDSLLVRLGIRLTWPDVYARLIADPWRQIGSVGTAIAIGSLVAALLIRWTNLGRAGRALALPIGLLLAGTVAAAAVAAAAAGDWTRFREFAWTGRHGAAFLPRLAAYLPWALLQQWLVLSYFNTRIRKAVPKSGWAGLPGRAVTAGLTGLAFGAMHWPSAPLVALTCLGGCVSGWLFQRDRSRNLFLFCLAHGLAGALLATLTPVRMDVGPRL